MEEKKPLKTKILRNTEVEPSIEIQIQKQKKILNLILYWYLTAAESFMVRKKIRLIPSLNIRETVWLIVSTRYTILTYLASTSAYSKAFIDW